MSIGCFRPPPPYFSQRWDLDRLRPFWTDRLTSFIPSARRPLVRNCGVKQPASGWPPSNLLCAQTQPNRNRRGVDCGLSDPQRQWMTRATFPLAPTAAPCGPIEGRHRCVDRAKIHQRYAPSCMRPMRWCSRLAVGEKQRQLGSLPDLLHGAVREIPHQDPRGTTQLPSMKLPRGQRP